MSSVHNLNPPWGFSLWIKLKMKKIKEGKPHHISCNSETNFCFCHSYCRHRRQCSLIAVSSCGKRSSCEKKPLTCLYKADVPAGGMVCIWGAWSCRWAGTGVIWSMTTQVLPLTDHVFQWQCSQWLAESVEWTSRGAAFHPPSNQHFPWEETFVAGKTLSLHTFKSACCLRLFYSSHPSCWVCPVVYAVWKQRNTLVNCDEIIDAAEKWAIAAAR